MEIKQLNLIGAIASIAILIICILVFIFRLNGYGKLEYWSGIAFMLCALPVAYLLYKAFVVADRPVIYFVQLALMLCFIIVEFLLDYLFKTDFRNIRWMTISYVTLFFASTGGMIGIASNAGRVWSLITVVLFFFMAGLAFFQRYKTGM